MIHSGMHDEKSLSKKYLHILCWYQNVPHQGWYCILGLTLTGWQWRGMRYGTQIYSTPLGSVCIRVPTLWQSRSLVKIILRNIDHHWSHHGSCVYSRLRARQHPYSSFILDPHVEENISTTHHTALPHWLLEQLALCVLSYCRCVEHVACNPSKGPSKIHSRRDCGNFWWSSELPFYWSYNVQ